MSKKKIAIIARTVGLEYDDRIRKEAIALSHDYEIFIYVNFTDNRDECGVTSYGVAYRSFSLKSRKILPQSKMLALKAIEFYLRVLPFLSSYDYIWAHEEYTFLFPLLYKKNRCVWDLHEIPAWFLSKPMRPVFSMIERKSIRVLHANEFRIRYLFSEGLIDRERKHGYLHNYPDREYLSGSLEDQGYGVFLEWLCGEDYVYLQGLSTPRRYPINSIESVLSASKLKILVVGRFDKESFNYLKHKYSDFEDRVYCLGMVDQLLTAKYLKNAKFSIILYDTKSANNRFCEPNRLYQALALKVPVIVGCNEPMSLVVDQLQVGVALSTDGEALEEIQSAVQEILKNYSIYKNGSVSASQKFLWDHSEVLDQSGLMVLDSLQ